MCRISRSCWRQLNRLQHHAVQHWRCTWRPCNAIRMATPQNPRLVLQAHPQLSSFKPNITNVWRFYKPCHFKHFIGGEVLCVKVISALLHGFIHNGHVSSGPSLRQLKSKPWHNKVKVEYQQEASKRNDENRHATQYQCSSSHDKFPWGREIGHLIVIVRLREPPSCRRLGLSRRFYLRKSGFLFLNCQILESQSSNASTWAISLTRGVSRKI